MPELLRTLAGFANLGLNLIGVFVFWLIVGLAAWPFHAWAERRRRERIRRLFSAETTDA